MEKDANYTTKTMIDWNEKKQEDHQLKDFLYQKEILGSPESKELRNQIHQEVFAKFNCLQCANCCQTTPPIFVRKDIKRIAAFLKMPPKTFKRKYILEDIDGSHVGIKVPCPFLNPDNTCSIYEVRPRACRCYPHTDEGEFHERPKMNLQNTIVCPAAYAIIKNLKERIS